MTSTSSALTLLAPMADLHVYFAYNEVGVSEPTRVARLASSREEAEARNLHVLSFAEFMAMDNAPELLL